MAAELRAKAARKMVKKSQKQAQYLNETNQRRETKAKNQHMVKPKHHTKQRHLMQAVRDSTYSTMSANIRPMPLADVTGDAPAAH